MDVTLIAGIAIAIIVVLGFMTLTESDIDSIKNVFSKALLLIPSVAYDQLLGSGIQPTIYMTMDQFMKVYVVNPNAYALHDITVWRCVDNKRYIIGFKGLNFYRYKKWRRRITDSGGDDEAYRRFMLEVVQKDVDMLTKKANEELDRGREELLRSLENPGGLKL